MIDDIRAKVTLALEESKSSEEKPEGERVSRKRQKPEGKSSLEYEAISEDSQLLRLDTPEKKRIKR